MCVGHRESEVFSVNIEDPSVHRLPSSSIAAGDGPYNPDTSISSFSRLDYKTDVNTFPSKLINEVKVYFDMCTIVVASMYQFCT